LAQRKLSFKALQELATEYSVEDNPLFTSTAKRYLVIQKTIAKIEKELANGDGLLTSKEYIKGRENIYVNPLLKELPKQADAANKTLSTMLDIIERLGEKKPPESKLDSFMKDESDD